MIGDHLNRVQMRTIIDHMATCDQPWVWREVIEERNIVLRICLSILRSRTVRMVGPLCAGFTVEEISSVVHAC